MKIEKVTVTEADLRGKEDRQPLSIQLILEAETGNFFFYILPVDFQALFDAFNISKLSDLEGKPARIKTEGHLITELSQDGITWFRSPLI
jgi:hypothetical protein